MGLLSAYTDDNKVIQSGLTITYSKSKVFGQWVAASMGSSSTVTYTEAWEYRRFAKGNFKFVGMDYESALSCANDMASKYVRDTKLSKWDPTGQSMFNAEFIVVDGGSVLMAEVAVQKTSGSMYEVNVQLNESDARTYINGAKEMTTVFAAENQRDYEEFEV